MKLLRRLKLALSCLLAVLLVGGSALPAPAVWQCRYSSHVVSAAFTPMPNAMPCLMGSSNTMNGAAALMPCCRPKKPAPQSRAQSGPELSCPACHPTLTSLAAASAAGLTESHLRLRQSLASMQAALPLSPAFGISVPLTLPMRKRPPPALGLSASASGYSPGLRAPPAV